MVFGVLSLSLSLSRRHSERSDYQYSSIDPTIKVNCWPNNSNQAELLINGNQASHGRGSADHRS